MPRTSINPHCPRCKVRHDPPMHKRDEPDDEPLYRITIPLRDSDGGDIVLTVDPHGGADDSAIPLDRMEHLADLGSFVMTVERVQP